MSYQNQLGEIDGILKMGQVEVSETSYVIFEMLQKRLRGEDTSE